MAWGYEKGFIIEHDDTLKKRVDCKSCVYYENMDMSCSKRPLYLPIDGYDSWKKCDYFRLDKNTSNYESKKIILKRRRNPKSMKYQRNQDVKDRITLRRMKELGF